MPNRDWRGNVVGTCNFAVRELASALPTLISVLLRIALLYLFFWYVVDFIYELEGEYLRFAICVGLSALLAGGLLGWKLINSWSKFDLDKDARRMACFGLFFLI
jgi:hypothetical protein